MESKTARLTVLIDPAKKKALEQLCSRQDLTPSQVVRQLIRDYLAEHGVSYGPDSAPDADAISHNRQATTAAPVHNPSVKRGRKRQPG